MILINNNWEQVKDLSDVVRIIKENIGDEFAQKVEKILFKEKQEILDKSVLVKDYTKEEMADMIIDLFETQIMNNKTIHILLLNCENLDNKIKKMKEGEQ